MILSLGLTRGLIGGVLGTLLGMGLTMVVRALTGMSAYEVAPVTAIGAVVGVLGFLTGVGAFTDWSKQAFGAPTTEAHGDLEVPQWTRYFNFDPNHKIIGVQYSVTSILVLLIGGTFALIFRTELAQVEMQFLTHDSYNTLMGLHGMLMIAGILLGVGGMANYLVPIQIGAQDMAFPRLNALSFWLFVPAAILLLLTLVTGGFDTGWTAYAPLSVKADLGMQFFFIGIYVAGLSSIIGSANLIVTIFTMRAPGMSLFKMPIFVWAILATALISLTATQFIGLSFLMVTLERLLGMNFFGAEGGNVILYQHIFWFYSHPAVYVFVLPGLGIISELLPVFSRKPLFGYKFIAMSSMAIAFLGFLVWAHHMFVSGMNINLRVVYMVTTMFIAVPTGIKFFSWLATMYGGKLSFETPMLFTLGAFVVFLIGGLSGPPNGLVVTDLFLHDTYWVVGHFHHTIFGGYVFPFMAAIYFWFPKVTGKMYNERLGKIHFWLMIIGFHIITLSMFWMGMHGMRRRIADYDPALDLQTFHLIATIGAFIVAFSVAIFVYNLWVSARAGEKAAMNPWNARGLEWMVASPPPEYNFDTPPTVTGEPYDFVKGATAYASLAAGD